ncbi:MAG TPA: glutaminyl-peptide cyclotransferase [Candidatus Coprenecus stercoravium]|uniref:Glutaminyl-peptide cyclotransferase n=1 Tax=Candidatus Coprenecus stercoravium TaxID=2840735 RepID=A0A9D2GQ21_9BACT|nr:glutaminyl-peptide cyclotransferase [Candidatus Coprenecus stercoravium]
MRGFLVPLVSVVAAASVYIGLSAGEHAAGQDGDAVRYVIASKEGIRHDMSAYTQGLFFYDGLMYESTGQYGESSFREVDPATGKVLRQELFPEEYFGEGSCVFDGRAYILTWYEGVCFVYDIRTFTKLAELPYQGQGWGITTDGHSLIMSDGSSVLSFRDPDTFVEQKRLEVRDASRPVRWLNELEYIDGKIWANVYGLEEILIIDPESGKVTGRVDCRGLLAPQYRTQATDVMNGIAYNPEDGALYLTGKYWPEMYKVELNELR